jgi:hypothetical protein
MTPKTDEEMLLIRRRWISERYVVIFVVKQFSLSSLDRAQSASPCSLSYVRMSERTTPDYQV